MTSAEHPSQLMTMGEAIGILKQSSPDITHSSLRFLEREGLITPQRTKGGHRLFSAADLNRIRLIKEWQASRLSLTEIGDRLARRDMLEAPAMLSNRFLDHVIQGDAATAAQVVLLADDLGMPLDTMFGQVLGPMLVEVGNRWESGALSIGQEHEITHLVREIIANLTLRHWREDPAAPVIVAATIASEQHDLGLRMILGLLRQRGARVHYLGANVSSGILIDAIRHRKPHIVLISISLERHVPELLHTLEAMATQEFAEGQPQVMIGGRGTAVVTPQSLPTGTVVPPGLPIDAMVEYILAAPSCHPEASARQE